MKKLVPIGAIIALELAVAAVVLASGFVAVSDDDFSRVVIAERFATAPNLDPSGTSWLPLPFLILGTKMVFLGRSLSVARLVAVGESVCALLLLYRAGRNLSLSPSAALAGTALAAVIPTGARLGVSFQPEALTAGLVAFGASTLSKRGSERLFGAFAMGAATLCRYEPWPAALAFATFCLIDGRGAPSSVDGPLAHRTAVFVAGFLAVFPAAAWMLHGALSHGSAVFFLHRVAAYRRALGGSESVAASLAAYPLALVRAEPELVFASTAALAVAARRSEAWLVRFWRVAVAVAALLAFLVTGRLIGGSPTHHDERPLLSVYWLLALVVSAGWFAVRDEARSGRTDIRAPRFAGLLLGLAGCGLVLRFAATHDPFVDRRAEIAIGHEAKARLGARDALLVDTGDYGYFAVIAAFGSPERAEPFDRRDPRDAPQLDAFSSSAALRSRLDESRASWFVARRENERIGAEIAAEMARNDRFVLFRGNGR